MWRVPDPDRRQYQRIPEFAGHPDRQLVGMIGVHRQRQMRAVLFHGGEGQNRGARSIRTSRPVWSTDADSAIVPPRQPSLARDLNLFPCRVHLVDEVGERGENDTAPDG